MDEADDGYVPQISQIDYNLMESGGGGGSGGNSSNPLHGTNSAGYYNSMAMYGTAADMHQPNQFQQATMQSNPVMPHPYSAMPPPHAMMGIPPAPPAQQPAPAPPAKAKRGGGRKKNAAAAANASQSASTESSAATPTQQPLPPSYPSAAHQVNPNMMQQMRQQQMANPYAAYPMQQPPHQAQAQQKWPDYSAMQQQQQQYRAMAQQPYPPTGYPMPPSAQGYYAANQQQQRPPPPQYYGHQQQAMYSSQYPGQTPSSQQQTPYSTPQANQQYYANMYAYPNQTTPGAAYPHQNVASQPSQKADSAPQQPFQQQQPTSTIAQKNPYQSKVPPSSSVSPAISQSNHMSTPNAYSMQQQPGPSQQQPSQWPHPSYNGVATPPASYYQQQQQQQQAMNPMQQNLQREIMELDRQYQQLSYHQQRTPEICMRLDQLQQRIAYLKRQQMSMQQSAAAQHSPQTSAAKNYPTYPPSNGQMSMDNAASQVAATSIPPPIVSSAAVQSNDNLGSVRGTPSVAGQDLRPAASSVSVMQTADSQVQVNIRPDAPGGRTLISVYHQYPSADVLTNSTNPITGPSSVSSNYSAKDAIPPEPVPSSISATEQLYARNQHNQVALSSAPSTSTTHSTLTTQPPITSTPTSDYSQQQTTNTTNQLETQLNTSPVPPQPVPSTISAYDSAINSRQTSMDKPNESLSRTSSVDEKPKSVVNAESSGAEEHPIERVENMQRQSSKEDSQVEDASIEPEIESQSGKDVENAEGESSEKPANNTNDSESFENELDDLQPPPAPRAVQNYEEDEEDFEMEEPVPSKNAEEEEMPVNKSDESIGLAPTGEVQDKPQEEAFEAEEASPTPLVAEAPDEAPLASTSGIEVGGETSKTLDDSSDLKQTSEEPAEEETEPSTSASKVDESETREMSTEQVVDEESSAVAADINDDEPQHESMEVEEEVETPVKPARGRAAKKRSRTSRAGKGRKKPAAATTTTQSRKRKKPQSEEEDEASDDVADQEFVPETSSRKRAKTKANAPPKVDVIAEPKLEDFVEKRRSERTRTERKTYSEKMDIDEELDEIPALQASLEASLEASPLQPAPSEWIVEKILGIRVVTKMVPKEVPEVEGSAQEEEATKTTEPTEQDKDQIDTKPDEPSTDIKSDELSVDAKPDEPSTNQKPDDREPESSNVNEKTTKEDDGKVVEESLEEKEVEMEEVQVEEIYVKYKGKSYLHCEWKSVEELEEMDKRVLGKINRFKAKFGEAYLDDSEYFNEDYTVVDRVLDEHLDEETGEHSAFIKWRSMAYEDCTWESIDVVPKSKLEEFHLRNDTIDPCKTKERARPEPDEWEKIPAHKEYKYENTLRDYQHEGVNWLLFCYYNSRHCILADEMGLGKTIQTITFLQGVYDKGIHGPFLVVVPLSTLANWEREFQTWTDMNAVVYHGGAASREILQQYEIFYDRGDSKKKKIVKFDALLTTYEMVVSDCEFLRQINYRVCVIDEAHRLKNRNSKLLTGGLLSFKLEHRVLLTGTPLQNNIQELYSLLNFLEPEQFSNSETFLQEFGQCQTEEQVQKLQEILKPMMLRRLKEDVEKTLQPKEETIVEVQLTNTQKKYYRAILERNFTHLLKGSSVPSLMNTMMELRKCCNHPFLIKGAEDQIISEFKPQHPERSEDELQLLALIQSSGKLVLIDKLLPKLRKDGHKVLVFSQMVRVLDLLEEFLVQMSYPYERIDGNIRGDLRQAAIDRFSKPDSDRFVFLLCTRAGGLGINLTAADTVIIFDSDWNPQNDLQAQARCHRIGQTKMVKVYRLITANTYEREMFDKASLKLGLDKAVLQSMTPKDNQQQLTRKEVEDLLRKGAYGAVMDDENEGSKFSEEDIDTILERRTQTIRLEPGVKGSTFAKASFTSSSNREDIDVNDPNFWSKWAKKANVEVNTGENDLIMSEPRARRKRFEDNYKGGESGGDGSDEDGNEPGASKGRSSRGKSEFSKSRSGKKRKCDDDDDYVNYHAPDELTFNKSEFFKVEKLLTAWGWGRWKAIKEHAELSLGERELEHISRTLLLHCIREYRGDEKIREFVWQLILPKNAVLGKGGKKGVIGGGLYHEGWATDPTYNPPGFALDSSFQRHIHRHANKLMQRIFHLFVLQAQILGSVDESAVHEKSYKEIQIDVPSVGDPPLSSWDADCDKSFLLGIYKHGMENFEAIRTDPKLCFADKEIEEFPTAIELNARFKRIILMLSRKLEMALAAATSAQTNTRLKRWPKAEEAEFMRLLRIYGVKDDHEGLNVINWNRFRELSSNLQNKTDAELLEELYCVLAMCTRQQGGELSEIDRRRASLVESIPAKQAERLMFRLHLMRKIHAIITTGLQNVRTSLKLCSNKTMPAGWGELHDEQLMIVVDAHGLDRITEKVSRLPAFEKIKETLDEPALLRRVMEICTTLETGRWNGRGSIEMLDDDGSLNENSGAAAASAQTPARSAPIQQPTRRGRKKNSTTNNPIAQSASPATNLTQTNAAAAQALMEATMLPLLNSAVATSTTSANSSASQQQFQQLQALMTMYALSSMLPMGSDATPSSSSASASAAANKQAMAALSMMGEDALNLTTNPKKTTATTSSSLSAPKPVTSTTSATISAKPTNSLSNTMDPTGQFNITELLTLLNLPPETNIPVVNLETGARLMGEKAPKFKDLNRWLLSHPKYQVDTGSMTTAGSSTSTLPVKEEAPTPSKFTDAAEPSTSNGVASTPKTASLEAKDLAKLANSASASTPSVISSAKKGNTSATDFASLTVGVFHKDTGIALPKDNWPTIVNLESWLDKNPGAQVQPAFAQLAKAILRPSYHDRIGSETTPTNSQQQQQQQAASAAANTLQQAASSAASLNNAQMNMEALQLQLYLQQKMLESLNPTAASYQNPYGSLLGANSLAALTPGMASNSSAGMDANTAALAALLGPQLSSTATLGQQTPSNSQTMKNTASNAGLDANTFAALFGAQLPATSTLNQQSSSNSQAMKMTNSNAEAALTAEILANPTLALLLQSGAFGTGSAATTTATIPHQNNNASSLNNLNSLVAASSASSFPFSGLDFNTALQLQAALSGATSMGSLTAGTSSSAAQSSNNSSLAASLLSSAGNGASKKPATGQSMMNAQGTSRASKLNAVVEKLASSSSQNTNNNS